MVSTSPIDTNSVGDPSPDDLATLREARDRLAKFQWGFGIDRSEAGLRHRLDALGTQPSNEELGSINRGTPHLDIQVYQIIKQYYARQFQLVFAVVFAFFKALTNAGGQSLLARRAGLSDLPIENRPSQWVHHGPLRVPYFAKPDFDAFEEAQGGSHITGARLIWWFAASADPERFGYSPDLGSWVCERLPWIMDFDGRLEIADGVLCDMTDCAYYLYDLLASGLARSPGGATPRAQTRPSGRAQPQAATMANSKTASPDPGSGRSARITLDHWAIGVYDENRLHLYQKVGGRWKFRREIDFGRWRATCKRLLSEFLAGGGVLSVRGAFEVLAAPKIDPEEQDFSVMRQLGGKKIFKLIKEEISHLRRYLRDILRESTSWPISRYEKGVGYKLYLRIGYSVDGMNEANVESGTYQFKEIPS